MKQTKTAREMLAKIEKDYFSGTGLAETSLLKGEGRRTFRLSQVERLLTEEQGALPLALWLSDEFWTADEGRVPMDDCNPLMKLAELQPLTDEERERLLLILEVAGLCHDLSLHFMFDVKEAFGVKDDFWVSNEELVEWLSTTKYERIAMHTAYILKKHAIGVYDGLHYLPAQDTLAEQFSTEHNELVRQPDNTKIPPRDYVRIILDGLLQIEQHWQQGMQLKLRPDLVMLHDEIYGVVPLQFDEGVLEAAQALFDYMDKEVQGRLVQSDDSTMSEVLGRFAEKVREVRAKYLAEGWVLDGSLEFNYLMSHAERCGYGMWREEDEAL